MTRLGMIFHNALGVERDPLQAALWWKKAADAGDADGQAMLGAAYHLGAGVPRDPVEALALLLRARASGSGLAEPFIASAQKVLSDDQLAEAQRRATGPVMEQVA